MSGEPRPSATVLLIRQAEAAPEVFMVQRNPATAFGDVFAFPGGVLDLCDRQAQGFCPNTSQDSANRRLAVESDALAFFSAAIRELFEEAGVLLARGADGEWAFSRSAGRDDLQVVRHRLNAGELQWPDMLRDNNLQLATDALHYFAHWITPRSREKRFSTRFFAAEIPPGQQAGHDGAELTDSRWMSAADVLLAFRSKDIQLIFPTYMTLKAISEFSDRDEVLDWARERSESGVAAVTPAVVKIDGRPKVVLPGDPRYPDHDEY